MTLIVSNADWHSHRTDIRGAAARGWYLARWLTTCTMVDGPVMKLVYSSAFQYASDDDTKVMRSVRRFLQEQTVISMRNAVAHWSVEWKVVDGDSKILFHNEKGELALDTEQAGAIHIITFAVIECLSDLVKHIHT